MGRGAGLRLIRHRDLAARWNRVGSGPGTLRYFVQYVGGPPPHPHGSRGVGIESDKGACGLHILPVGNRMPEHTHPAIEELYFVVRGRMAVGSGTREVVAGPLDCVHIPAGTPHTSRNVAAEDVQFLWVQWGFDAPDRSPTPSPKANRRGRPRRATGGVPARAERRAPRRR